MAKEHKKHGVGIYVVVALILAVITYVEFVIVEYPVAWLTSGQTLFWLVAMSLVKFWMVIWFFMHLRDDPKIYTGFFSSGMLIALGTFVALSFLSVLPAAVAPQANAEEVEARTAVLAALRGEAHDAPDDAHGAAPAAAGRAVPPADRTLTVAPPAAATGGFEVDLEAAPPAETGAQAPDAPADAQATEPAAEPEAASEAAAEADAVAEPEPEAPVVAQADADPTYDTELGASTYAANCAACHHATGVGIPGVFPPVAGHAAELYAADGGIGGRAYLIDVLLYGVQGPITVDGANYNGLMPGWQQLSDAQIAAVANHVVAGFDGAPEGFDAIRAEEVAAARGQGLTSGGVYELRGALGLE
jgi:mono/diheme cytochrome c family protein